MKVVALNNDLKNSQPWQKFCQQAGLFYSEKWQEVYKGRDFRICALLNNNNEIIGAFQYLEFKKVFFRMAITPPFCPSIGLQFNNPGESIVGRNSFTKDLLTAVADYFKTQGHHLVDLALPADIQDTQPFTWKAMRSVFRYSYWIDLRQSEEELWKKLSGEKRKSIGKAEKDGLEITLTEDFKAVADLIISSLRRNKALSNEDLIRKIISPALKEHAIAFVAKKEGQLMAATFCLRDRDRVIYLFGGTNSEYRHHGAGVSCMWQSIGYAKANGASIFDFEGSMQPGIEKYFREFGGDLVPYAAIEKSSFLMTLLKAIKKK